MVQSSPDSVTRTALHLEGPGNDVHEHISTIKRLVRDVFQDLMMLKKRVRDLEPGREQSTQLMDPRASSALRRRSDLVRRTRSTSVVSHSHTFEASAGYRRFVSGISPTDEDASDALDVSPGPLLHSRVNADLDPDTTLEARLVTTQDSTRLWHAKFQRNVNDFITVTVFPFGGRLVDATSALHPSPGEGLTHFVREGCPMHAAVMGPGVALRAALSRMSVTLSQFAAAVPEHGLLHRPRGSDDDNDGSDGSFEVFGGHSRGGGTVRLAQVNASLARSLSVGLLMRLGDTHALRDVSDGRGRVARGQFIWPGAACGSDVPGGEDPGSTWALTAAWDVGGGTCLSGFLAPSAGESLAHAPCGIQLSGRPSSSGTLWNVAAAFSREGAELGLRHRAAVVEASMQFQMADGIQVIPGIVYSQASATRALAAVARMQWQF